MLRRTALAATVAALLVPSAASADVPTAGADAPSGATIGAPCNDCTAIQTSGDDYALPPGTRFITGWRFRNGTSTAGGVRLQVWRPQAGGAYTLVQESSTRDLSSVPANAVDFNRVVIPVQPGDVLGLRHVGTATGGPVQVHASSDPGDAVTAGPASPVIGTTFTPAPGAVQRLNLFVTLDSDDDGDGSPDRLMDLCPGNALRGTGQPCSGTLIGSPLAAHAQSGRVPCAAAPCTALQVALGEGGTATVPYDGVIVRWRHRAFGANAALRVLRRVGPGVHTAISSSPPSPGTGAFENAIVPARIPVRAGDRIGVTVAADSLPAMPSVVGAEGAIHGGPAPTGSTAAFSSSSNLVFPYDADVERDADRDGFGDETQDGCATDATRQGACSPSLADTRAPILSAVRLSRTRIPRRNGARVRFTLSEAATVAFKVERRAKGRRAAGRCVKPTRRNRGAKRCTRWVKKGAFTRALLAGKNDSRLATRRLRLGRGYRLAVQATDAAGNRSRVARVRFRLVR